MSEFRTLTGHTVHPCARERLWVAAPDGISCANGWATVVQKHMLDGSPVSVQVFFDTGVWSIVPVAWLHDAPPGRPAAAIIPFPPSRIVRRAPGAGGETVNSAS